MHEQSVRIRLLGREATAPPTRRANAAGRRPAAFRQTQPRRRARIRRLPVLTQTPSIYGGEAWDSAGLSCSGRRVERALMGNDVKRAVEDCAAVHRNSNSIGDGAEGHYARDLL